MGRRERERGREEKKGRKEKQKRSDSRRDVGSAVVMESSVIHLIILITSSEYGDVVCKRINKVCYDGEKDLHAKGWCTNAIEKELMSE